jgi:hypothetical protein
MLKVGEGGPIQAPVWLDLVDTLAPLQQCQFCPCSLALSGFWCQWLDCQQWILLGPHRFTQLGLTWQNWRLRLETWLWRPVWMSIYCHICLYSGSSLLWIWESVTFCHTWHESGKSGVRIKKALRIVAYRYTMKTKDIWVGHSGIK